MTGDSHPGQKDEKLRNFTRESRFVRVSTSLKATKATDIRLESVSFVALSVLCSKTRIRHDEAQRDNVGKPILPVTKRWGDARRRRVGNGVDHGYPKFTMLA